MNASCTFGICPGVCLSECLLSTLARSRVFLSKGKLSALRGGLWASARFLQETHRRFEYSNGLNRDQPLRFVFLNEPAAAGVGRFLLCLFALLRKQQKGLQISACAIHYTEVVTGPFDPRLETRNQVYFFCFVQKKEPSIFGSPIRQGYPLNLSI